ncbi:fimbrial biogenesis chaperone [Klebsiella michiganensis]|nr:molecular chaperone [Klebsiella michiganensis]MEB8290178.1 molecular chaperone [Klebsiella michiganensis]
MKYKVIWLFLPVISIFAGMANASVVMTGTRVIFPSSVMEKTIQLKNPDPQPYVVQLQMTDENGKADKNSFFSPVPPVFRMEPNTGQSVRLIFTGRGLPEDKESVFYLDFTQLPSLKKSQQEQNRLIIAIRNRVKVFYRPASLEGTQSDAYRALSFSLENGKLNVDNPTGFYIPIREASLSINGQNIALAESVMLPPKTKTLWPLSKKITTLTGSRLHMIFVNDYGVDVKRERVL